MLSMFGLVLSGEASGSHVTHAEAQAGPMPILPVFRVPLHTGVVDDVLLDTRAVWYA